MHKTVDTVIIGQEKHGGRFWRTVAAGGVRAGAVLGSAGLVYLGSLYADPSNFVSSLIANEIYPFEGSVLLGLAAGAAARKISHH